MDAPTLIPDLERAARRAGVSVNDLCKQADVNRSTWQRWKKGLGEPKATSWTRLHELRSQYLGAA